MSEKERSAEQLIRGPQSPGKQRRTQKMGPKFCPTIQDVCRDQGRHNTSPESLHEVSSISWYMYSGPPIGSKELQGTINSKVSRFVRSVDKLSKDKISRISVEGCYASEGNPVSLHTTCWCLCVIMFKSMEEGKP